MRLPDVALERWFARLEFSVRFNLQGFMDEHSTLLEWVPPRAGTVVLPRLRDGRPAERLVEAKGVLVLPGSVFGDRPDRFRIGFGRRDTPESLAALGRFLRSSAA